MLMASMFHDLDVRGSGIGLRCQVSVNGVWKNDLHLSVIMTGIVYLVFDILIGRC